MKETKRLFLDFLKALAERNAQNLDTGLSPTFEMFINWLVTGRIEI